MLLILVTLSCLIGTLILDTIGKEPFAQEYSPGLVKGTLVSLSGPVDEVTSTTQGNHLLLRVRDVPVFIPLSSYPGRTPVPGEWIRVYGTIQEWQGTDEILVQNPGDILFMS